MTVPAIVTARHPYLLTNPDEMGPTYMWEETAREHHSQLISFV